MSTFVDDEDFDFLSKNKWAALFPQGKNIKRVYAVRWSHGKLLLMHREILKPPSNLCVDHANGDCLNNQRNNLRLATRSQNTMNKKVVKTGAATEYRGVWFDKRSGLWVSYIQENKIKHRIGTFSTAIEAAKAYDVASFKYHGEFGRRNF